MKKLFFLVMIVAMATFTGCSQAPTKKQSATTNVGGRCEGCEAIYESSVPFEKLTWTAILPDFTEPGPKMVISGTIYKPDGKTPAPGVVLYVYHTDQSGHYSKKGGEKGWALRHGYIRGWVKSNEKGEYKFFTLKPASYPGAKIPAHIHPVIYEPGKNEYWIDEYLFDGDPFLTPQERKKQEKRGGSGIIVLEELNGVLYGKRDIVLGQNIPDYHSSQKNTTPLSQSANQSGLSIGANCPAFDPLHLSGVDAGKRTCPMCRYGYGQGLMVWINHTDIDRMDKFVRMLEHEMQVRGERKFRVFVLYINPTWREKDKEGQLNIQQKISAWCIRQNLKKVSVAWIPSPVDESCRNYKINPSVYNTVIAYKQRKIVAKWINVNYSDESLSTILKEF
jgi:protocatechuate 3,4-dioxygenase beta subunit